MSDRPISVGDLVVIVRWKHIHRSHNLGKIAVVEATADNVSCQHCAWRIYTPCAILSIGGNIPMDWLKRIPPLGELESVTTEAQIEEKV